MFLFSCVFLTYQTASVTLLHPELLLSSCSRHYWGCGDAGISIAIEFLRLHGEEESRRFGIPEVHYPCISLPQERS